MLDDDIVCLGSSNPNSSSSINLSNALNALNAAAQPPVTGIALHIEGPALDDGSKLLFRKATNSVVHIGRRSGEARQSSDDLGIAMFRCAVVSRKHAKIAFTDNGHAFVIDTGSHHGTHIRKPGDKFSKALKPETPTALADGDIITFGKSVGKGSECVNPVVARVELLFDNNSINLLAFTPPAVPTNSTTTVPSLDKDLKSGKSSGRYGIVSSPSSSSDDSYSSNSEIYSDIEEIPPPLPFKPAQESSADNANNNTGTTSSLGHALDVLKLLIPRPPVQLAVSAVSTPPSAPQSLCKLPALRFVKSHCSFSNSDPPNSIQSSQPAPAPSASASIPIPAPRLPSPLPSSLNLACLPGFDPSVFDLSEFDFPFSKSPIKSRSNSPMDLASSSAGSPAPEDIEEGAWSPYSPPFRSVSLPYEDVDVVPNSAIVDGNDFAPVNSPDSEKDAEGDAEGDLEEDVQKVDKPDPPLAEVENKELALATNHLEELKQMHSVLQMLNNGIDKLQVHRRRHKTRINHISKSVISYDDRLAEVDSEYAVLSDKLESMQGVEIPDLIERVDIVECRMERVESRLGGMKETVGGFEKENGRMLMMIEDVEKMMRKREDSVAEREKNLKLREEELEKMRVLVEEMKILRHKNQLESEKHLSALNTMATTKRDQELNSEWISGKFEEFEKSLDGMRETRETRLKRKRGDEDEEDDHAGAGEKNKEIAEDVVMSEPSNQIKVPSPISREGNHAPALAYSSAEDAPPSRKRARLVGGKAKTLASVVGKTATAVTIGAIVTWSALAFS